MKAKIVFALLLLFMLAVLMSSSARCAIAFDDSSSAHANNDTLVWSHTCTGSDLYLVVEVALRTTTYSIDSCHYDGVKMSAIGASAEDGHSYTLFGLVGPSTGTNDVIVWISNSWNVTGCAVSYTGVDSGTPTYNVADTTQLYGYTLAWNSGTSSWDGGDSGDMAHMGYMNSGGAANTGITFAYNQTMCVEILPTSESALIGSRKQTISDEDTMSVTTEYQNGAMASVIFVMTAASDSVTVSPVAANADASATNPTVVTTDPQTVAPTAATVDAIAINPNVVGGHYYPSGTNLYYVSPPYSRGGNRAGNNSYSGSHPDTAWATLGYAASQMVPVDTLFVMGGVYTNAQKFNTIGRAGDFTVKAYGDSQAVFDTTGSTGENDMFFYLPSGVDSVTIDGYSYLDPESSGWIKLISTTAGWHYIGVYGTYSGSITNWCDNITIRGIIIDGDTTGGLSSDRHGSGIQIIGVRNSLIEDNYISPNKQPTGNISPGDGSDVAQGGGYGISVLPCERVIIRNNTIKHCNHGAVDFIPTSAVDNIHKYITVKDNFIEQHYGGGIYLTGCAEYNLVDGNIITRCGETTTYPKPGIQVSGPHNVIRRNILYNPQNEGLGLNAQSYATWHYITDSCMVYNNTVFGTGGWNSFKIYIYNTVSADCSAEKMLIANNIFYKSTGTNDDREAEINADTYHSNDAHNWITPDDTNTEPVSTHWGGNIFTNNCVRRNSDGASHDTLIVFTKDGTYGGFYFQYSLDSLHSQDPTAWVDNIGTDPLLTSESPDAYGLNAGWWYPQAGSDCIDGGISVNDTIGAYVEGLYAGYGWDTLTWEGSAPDIGAYESEGDITVIPNAAFAEATAANPTVYADMTLFPAAATAEATAVNPAVYSDATVSPAAATAAATAVNPTVGAGVSVLPPPMSWISPGSGSYIVSPMLWRAWW